MLKLSVSIIESLHFVLVTFILIQWFFSFFAFVSLFSNLRKIFSSNATCTKPMVFREDSDLRCRFCSYSIQLLSMALRGKFFFYPVLTWTKATQPNIMIYFRECFSSVSFSKVKQSRPEWGSKCLTWAAYATDSLRCFTFNTDCYSITKVCIKMMQFILSKIGSSWGLLDIVKIAMQDRSVGKKILIKAWIKTLWRRHKKQKLSN